MSAPESRLFEQSAVVFYESTDANARLFEQSAVVFYFGDPRPRLIEQAAVVWYSNEIALGESPSKLRHRSSTHAIAVDGELPGISDLLARLLSYLHSGFDKSPDAVTALRVRHESDSFSWQVLDRHFIGYLGDDPIFNIPLTGLTLAGLAEKLALIDGITVVYMASEMANLSACTLIRSTGRQSESNGDIVSAYRSLTWAMLDSLATELHEAKRRIYNMLDQMSVRTADVEWLDEWGGYFSVLRRNSEPDTSYSGRIIAEILRPKANNKAIEKAILERYGLATSVVDVVKWGDASPAYNGLITHDGSHFYNASASPQYGLFKVIAEIDWLSSGALLDIVDFVNSLRDAGTHMAAFELAGAAMADTAQDRIDEGIVLVIGNFSLHNDTIVYDGSSTYGSGASVEFI